MPLFNKHIIFLHIPKTGGTTLRDIFSRQYSENEMILTETLAESENTIKALNDSDKHRLLMIQGHMKFGLHNYFDKEFQYFSMMREPVKRVISQYTYVLSMKNNPQNLSTESGEMTIRQYYESGIYPQLVNGQTQLISGKILDRDTSQNVANEYLETAKKNIEKHFFLIGLTERFNETLLLLKRELEWKTPYYSKANITKKKPGHSKISQDDIDFIKANNQLDIQLYDFATSLFNEKLISANNDFENDLKRFNRNNKIRAVFYAMPKIKRKLSRIFK